MAGAMGLACPGAPVEVRSDAICRLSTAKGLFFLAGLGFAVRLYLALSSYCMSGDGMGYLKMAQEFASSQTRLALAGLFSPLYPALIALLHPLVPNWEFSADLISVILGTAAIVTVFGMTRAIFGRDDYALGAAALASFHPDLAAYAASVRTEAGFMLLMTSAVWLTVNGLRHRRVIYLALAGLIGGAAYLYRTEAIGLLPFIAAFTPLGAILWRRWKFTWSLAGSALFSLAFLLIASPYLIFLHTLTGRWSVGREFTAAMILGMGGSAPRTAAWRNLGFSATTSPFAPMFSNPRLYLFNSASHFADSWYGFIEALGIVLTVLMMIGLWRRRRDLASNFGEALIGLLILFYLTGFSLSYTGTRFMSHLIPYTFGWVMAGIEAGSSWLELCLARMRWPLLPQGALTVLVIAAMLPEALWPVGYDQRGLRYAGEQIRKSTPTGAVVAARDGRVAYYGDSRFIMLPDGPMPDLCAWLVGHDASYLLLTDRDEERISLQDENACLRPMRRYPRHGNLYYDLFTVVNPH